MSDDTYNGWVNRETWAVALHLGNDYNLYHETCERVKYKTHIEAADELEGWVTDLFNFVLHPQPDDQVSDELMKLIRSMMSDVGSLWRVNWRDVAASFMEDNEPAPDAHLDDVGD